MKPLCRKGRGHVVSLEHSVCGGLKSSSSSCVVWGRRIHCLQVLPRSALVAYPAPRRRSPFGCPPTSSRPPVIAQHPSRLHVRCLCPLRRPLRPPLLGPQTFLRLPIRPSTPPFPALRPSRPHPLRPHPLRCVEAVRLDCFPISDLNKQPDNTNTRQ